MQITNTTIPEVLLFEPKTHFDERGYFMETFRASYFSDRDLEHQFVQDNQSFSVKGTLRGLHCQRHNPQGKLVRVVSGEIFDVAVDIREGSPFLGQWVGEYLSSDNHRQLWIPPGFAHGFYVTSETAVIAYKCSGYYCAEDEVTILWRDPSLSIHWPIYGSEPLLSAKDSAGLTFNEFRSLA